MAPQSEANNPQTPPGQSPASLSEAQTELQILRTLVKETGQKAGAAFFGAMVKNLSRALGASHASIGLCDPHAPDQIRTQAFWNNDHLHENIRYTATDTPCGKVLEQGIRVYRDNVRRSFPKAPLLIKVKARSYVGVPLIDLDGRCHGLLNIVGQQPIAPNRIPLTTRTLETFAAHALAEVTRLEAHRVLVQNQKKLESLVQKRTEALRASQNLLVLNTRLASLGTLASGIAHEINNPLGSIHLAAETLRTNSLDPELRSSALEHIFNAVSRCKTIVQNIQRFVRSESSIKNAVDLHQSIQATVRIFSREEASSEISLKVTLASALPPVLANQEEIQQVLLNLMRNAFVAPGVCQVALHTAFDPETRFISISVEDDGDGIPPENLPHIFDPFFTSRSAQGGTGLGLSISHDIIKDHGGSIDVNSAPGRGTTFKIKLPSLN